LAGLRMLRPLQAIGKCIREICPEAWVINLTNPMSLAVRTLADCGIQKVVGLCELPKYTACCIAQTLGIRYDDLEWDYVGLNHRGFIHHLHASGSDLWPSFLERIGNQDTFLGIPFGEIVRLKAVPVKYFQFFLGKPISKPGRAAEVRMIRDQLAEEMVQLGGRFDEILVKRDLSWYSQAVVPFISAILNDTGQAELINYFSMSSRVVMEAKAFIFQDGFEPVQSTIPSEATVAWLDRFKVHETASYRAMVNPEMTNILDALKVDPMPMYLNGTIQGLAEGIQGSIKVH
jgi:6-phospho-beta-glucosidase